jgi:hypothetical protein
MSINDLVFNATDLTNEIIQKYIFCVMFLFRNLMNAIERNHYFDLSHLVKTAIEESPHKTLSILFALFLLSISQLFQSSLFVLNTSSTSNA